jgi:hypothetical protein
MLDEVLRYHVETISEVPGEEGPQSVEEKLLPAKWKQVFEDGYLVGKVGLLLLLLSPPGGADDDGTQQRLVRLCLAASAAARRIVCAGACTRRCARRRAARGRCSWWAASWCGSLDTRRWTGARCAGRQRLPGSLVVPSLAPAADGGLVLPSRLSAQR